MPAILKAENLCKRFGAVTAANAIHASIEKDSVVGLIACLLLVYRILQPPGPNAAAVVKVGAPLGLLCAGLLTLGARVASRADREEPARSA